MKTRIAADKADETPRIGLFEATDRVGTLARENSPLAAGAVGLAIFGLFTMASIPDERQWDNYWSQQNAVTAFKGVLAKPASVDRYETGLREASQKYQAFPAFSAPCLKDNSKVSTSVKPDGNSTIIITTTDNAAYRNCTQQAVSKLEQEIVQPSELFNSKVQDIALFAALAGLVVWTRIPTPRARHSGDSPRA